MEEEMKQLLENILEMPVSAKMETQLRTLGFEDDKINNKTAIAVSLYQQAIKGNVNAIKIIKTMSEDKEKKTIEQKDITKLVEKEEKRLLAIFKDIDDKKKEISSELIHNTAFMGVTLKELIAEISKNGVKEEYKNGANQFGYKDSIEVKTYNNMIKNYMAAIKTLADILNIDIDMKNKLNMLGDDL